MTPEPCPLCGATDVTPYWPRVWQSPGRAVYACAACRVLFVWPQLDPEATAALYTGYADHLAARGVIDRPETAAQTFARRAPAQGYRRRILAPYLPDGAAVAEIGGGCGNFIGPLWAEGRLSAAALVEPCPPHREFAAERFPGLVCAADVAELAPRRFDVLVALHVLEHIAQPGPFLTCCAGLLAPGGRLVLETPSAADPLLSLYDCAAYKDFYFQPMHHYVYGEDALRRLLGAHGFTALAFEHVQRYPLSNHLAWLSKGRPGGDGPLDALLGGACQDAYRERLRAARRTDTVFGIFTPTVRQ
jgi:SAM-dependent methyltransferase